MNLFAKRLVSSALSLVLAMTASTISATAVTPDITTASGAYVVIDAASGQVLIEKNMNTRKAPASITKILTLALALERGGIMTDVITVSNTIPYSISAGSTHIALEAGESITFRDAVMATQLISANDAANVVAEYVSGSIPSFVSRMNEKVAEMSLTGTRFANPNGLDDKNHYVTAYDMAQITRYALGVPGFRDIFAATEYQMAPTNKKARNYKFFAQNAIVFPDNREYYEGITGSKLGYTHNAQHTLVASAKRGSMELIVVTLGSASSSGKYTDAKQLLDYCFERYETMTIPAKELRAADVPISSIENPTATVSFGSDSDHSFVVPLGTLKSSLDIRYQIPEMYKSERSIAPSFSVYLPSGELIYTAPMKFSVMPIERMAQTPVDAVPKLQTDMTEIMVVAFKCLLVGLGVFAVLFIICRSAIMIHYTINKRRSYKKKLAMVQRRQVILDRTATELARMEQELGVSIASLVEQKHPANKNVPNNVTHIYPRQRSTGSSNRSASSRK